MVQCVIAFGDGSIANSVQLVRSFFPYERNRSRNTKNAERAKQPLLLLTSAILNHNCPALLVRRIHRRKAPFSRPSLCQPLLSSSLIPFAVLSSSRAIALLLLLSGIPSLVLPLFHPCPRCLSFPRGQQAEQRCRRHRRHRRSGGG